MGADALTFFDGAAALYVDSNVSGYVITLVRRYAIQRAWSEFFRDTPLVISPVWTQPPFPHSWNLTHPAETMSLLRPVMPANVLGLAAHIDSVRFPPACEGTPCRLSRDQRVRVVKVGRSRCRTRQDRDEPARFSDWRVLPRRLSPGVDLAVELGCDLDGWGDRPVDAQLRRYGAARETRRRSEVGCLAGVCCIARTEDLALGRGRLPRCAGGVGAAACPGESGPEDRAEHEPRQVAEHEPAREM